MGSESHAILCALHDSLMLLAPRGWLQAELEIAPSVRLVSISAKGGGGAKPQPHPQLNLDTQQEAQRFSEGLADLVASSGKDWSGPKVVVERDDDHADWKLLRADGSTAWLGRLDKSALDSLLYTESLFAMLSGSERAFAMLQTDLTATLGEQVGWREQGGALEIQTAGGVQRWSSEPIGVYSLDELSFTWAWASAPERAQRIEAVCAPKARQPGLSVLWRPHLHCDEGFAWALAGHAAVALGSRGVFRAEEKGRVGLHALMKRL
jgi:hypothetical protein